MKMASGVLGLAMVLTGPSVWSQTATEPAKAGAEIVQTFFLHNVSEAKEVDQVTTALRNLLDPHVRIYLVPAENAIVVRGEDEQIRMARRLLEDLDKPKKSYRLRYTITDLDGDKQVGVQHFALVVVSGAKTMLKNGSKVPIATGEFHEGGAGTQTQMTYLDVGLNIDVKIDESLDGVRLESKVERSEVAESVSIAGIQEPTIRQAVLQGTSILTAGKPVMLGSVDIPGSTRHLDVAVMMEPVK
jgi:type II secretory pathway component GspD/PulD (secretin)